MTLVSDALAIARAGVRAVDPAAAVARTVVRTSDGVRLSHARLRVALGGRFHLVAIGKAAAAMVDSAHRILGSDAVGLAITPRGYPSPRSGIPVLYGDHPIPGPGSFRSGAELLRRVRSTDARDAVLFLISGGGSAVVEQSTAPVTPVDLARTTACLLRSGAPIGALNAVRRHLSEIKGGRLAVATTARSFGTVALSDVVGDPPEDIASGPTVGDPTTFGTAESVVRRYHLRPLLPARVLGHLREGSMGRLAETPKPAERRLASAPFVVAASNSVALVAAAREARLRGYATRVLSSHVVGETQPVARAFARKLIASGSHAVRPVALLSGGETTVTLGPRPGKGGRNQEFALAAAGDLARARSAVVLSLGTDGIDGPTDAAGGWADETTARYARSRGIDLAEVLRRHAAYSALEKLGGLVKTGPTGTNVMDVHVGLVARPRQSEYGRK